MIRVNEWVESKEFRDFIDSIPFDTIKEYVLLPHLSLWVTKHETMDYIDIFGNPASNIKLEIIIENKYENIVYELGEMYL